MASYKLYIREGGEDCLEPDFKDVWRLVGKFGTPHEARHEAEKLVEKFQCDFDDAYPDSVEDYAKEGYKVTAVGMLDSWLEWSIVEE